MSLRKRSSRAQKSTALVPWFEQAEATVNQPTIVVGVLPSTLTMDDDATLYGDSDGIAQVLNAVANEQKARIVGSEIAHRYNQHHALLDALEELVRVAAPHVSDIRKSMRGAPTCAIGTICADVAIRLAEARKVLDEARS